MGRQSHKAVERILKIGSMTESEAYKFLRSEKFVGHRVSLFSTGVSSAVATKLAIDEIDQIELDSERGRHEPPIADDCGIMCEPVEGVL